YVNAAQELRLYAINITREASGYKYLKGIKIDGVEISGFAPETMEYEVTVPAVFNKINIEPILGHKNQTISGDGVIDFEGNTANAEILVISENKEETSAYKLKFIREKSTKLRSLTFNNSTYSVNFSPSILEYNLEINYNTFSLPLTAIPCYEGATVTVVGDKYIAEDENLITIKVELEGIESTTYQIHLIRKDVAAGYIYETGYTGKIEEFVVPFSGVYKLEVWGAQGAEKKAGTGGYGAYSTGSTILAGDSIVYIGVGGQGAYRAGGFNGGGNGQYQAGSVRNAAGGGGGATHIARKTGLLSTLSNDLDDILIVASAGGGASESNNAGGSGGGIQGNDGKGGCYLPTGGTQTNGGVRGYSDASYGGFGAGGSAPYGSASGGTYGAGGGGAGFYGGGGASYASVKNCAAGGAGGSGYIGNSKLKDKVMYCYDCIDSSIVSAKTISTMNVDSEPISEYAKKGHGYARITYLSYVSANNYLDSITLDDGNIELDFEPSKQEYDVYLPKEITKLKIDATPKDEKATIVGTGIYNTKPGEQTHEIIVTAEDGSTRTYTLNITREKSDYPYPDNIKITNFNQSLCSELDTYCHYTFDKDTALYEILVPFRMDRIDFEVELNSEYQGLKIVKIVDGEEQETNALVGGINTFEITTTSEDEKYSITYT
ncbi:MAG: cadherin-like beta sandwich domain-containing protein, partial [Bacilli bacterium]|nr:cadherin-like beta sandwich domain-containing protein [Bacilli bacterium]